MDAKQEHEGYKVRSLLGQELSREVIQAKYDEIYQQEEVWRRRTFVGYASLILHLLREELPDKYMLDAGCGAGK